MTPIAPGTAAGRWPRPAVLLALAAALLGSACAAPAPPAPAAADAVGDWHGRIEVPGSPLDIGLSLSADGGSADVPAQGATDLPLSGVRLDGRTVVADLPAVQGRFEGELSADGATISGTYTQSGQALPFRLERGPLPAPARPQEPKPPLPYRAEDVTYPGADAPLAATLTLPDGPGPFAAVVMITGSGPQDRDEALAGHRPFLVLADAITRAGYAVLRVDDRGVGGSAGDYAAATYPDLADDTLAGVAYLGSRPEIDRTRIGLFGHSEGGYLAPLAAQRGGGSVAFEILMAGPAVPGEEVLVRQNELLLAQAGASPADVAGQVDYIRRLSALLRAGDEDGALALARARVDEQSAALPAGQRPTPEQVEAQLTAISAEYRRFAPYDPAPALSALSVPVLAFYGDKDLQVPADQSAPVLTRLLAGKPDVTVETLPGLNHLMQPATTGSPTEYPTIETTVAPEVLDLVTGWLRARF